MRSRCCWDRAVSEAFLCGKVPSTDAVMHELSQGALEVLALHKLNKSILHRRVGSLAGGDLFFELVGSSGGDDPAPKHQRDSVAVLRFIHEVSCDDDSDT